MSAPLVACVLGAILSALPLDAQPATLLGPDLEPQRVTLRAYSDAGVEIIDESGTANTLPIDEVIRLTLLAEPTTQSDEQHIAVALRDGQVVVGRLLGPGAAGESLRVALASGGREVEVALDDMLSIRLKAGVKLPRVEEDDALVLATGETLVGFVESMSTDSVAFIVGEADDPIDIPLDRVHGIALANKPEPAQPEDGKRLTRVQLSDGSVLLLAGAKTAKSTEGALSVTGRSVLPIDPPTLTLPMDQITSLGPVSGRYTLSSLMRFDMSLKSGGEVFGVPMPPRMKPNGAIAMHAPAVVGFDLPKGAGRLVFTAALNLGDDIPARRRALAGCELVVYDGDEAVGGCTLSAQALRHRLNLPLKTGNLRLELKPGVNGPVLDRVLLTDAEVLVSQP